jgi:hypothetical protein
LKSAYEAYEAKHPDQLYATSIAEVNAADQALRDAQNGTNQTQKPVESNELKGTPDASGKPGQEAEPAAPLDAKAPLDSKAPRDGKAAIAAAEKNVETKNKNVATAKKVRQQYYVKYDIWKMRTQMSSEMKDTAAADVKNIEKQIAELRVKLSDGKRMTVTTRQAIVDVVGEEGKPYAIVKAEPILSATSGLSTDTQKSGESRPKEDPWTKIAFSASPKSEGSQKSASAKEASFQAKYGAFWSSVEVSTSGSKAKESMQKRMASCDISGTL